MSDPNKKECSYSEKPNSSDTISRHAAIDVTVLTDTGLPKTWKCPHCGKRNQMGQYKEEELFEFFKTMQHCGQCGYIHLWELRLTDEFKQSVVNMLMGEMK